MDSGLIGKIEKAKRYAEERDRIQFSSFEANIKGENNDHTVSYKNGEWNCTCNYFQTHRICAHTMGLEFILEGMITPHEEISL